MTPTSERLSEPERTPILANLATRAASDELVLAAGSSTGQDTSSIRLDAIAKRATAEVGTRLWRNRTSSGVRSLARREEFDDLLPRLWAAAVIPLAPNRVDAALAPSVSEVTSAKRKTSIPLHSVSLRGSRHGLTFRPISRSIAKTRSMLSRRSHCPGGRGRGDWGRAGTDVLPAPLRSRYRAEFARSFSRARGLKTVRGWPCEVERCSFRGAEQVEA
jgi:hypothetical protein